MAAATSIPGAKALGEAFVGQRKVRYRLPIANKTGPQRAINIQKILALGALNLFAANTPAPLNADTTPKARKGSKRSIFSSSAPR